MIGKQKDIIVISGRAANVSDGYGGVVEAWETKWAGYAGVERLSGRRAIEAAAQVIGADYQITIRKSPDFEVRKTDRIDVVKSTAVVDVNGDAVIDIDSTAVVGGGQSDKTFSILSIDDDGDRWITILAATTR